MSEYATLKRRPILFPDSVSSFHDSIFYCFPRKLSVFHPRFLLLIFWSFR